MSIQSITNYLNGLFTNPTNVGASEINDEGYVIVENTFNHRLTNSTIDAQFHPLLQQISSAIESKQHELSKPNLDQFPDDLKQLLGEENFLKLPYLDLAKRGISEICAEDLSYTCMCFSNSKEGYSGLIYSPDRQKINIFSGSPDSTASWSLTVNNTFPAELIDAFGADSFEKIPLLSMSKKNITEIKAEEFRNSPALRLLNTSEGHIGVALLIDDTIKIYHGPRTSPQNWCLNEINIKKLQRNKNQIEHLNIQKSSNPGKDKQKSLVTQIDEANKRLTEQLTPKSICLKDKQKEISDLYKTLNRQ